MRPTGVTRSRSRYDGSGYDEGKKITGLGGFVALWVLLKYRFTE